ncbi:MAG: hypothetical protein ACK4HF_03240 [Paracoccaceae bacterium]
MEYQTQCDYGRDCAAHAMRIAQTTGNLPALVRAIREAAKDETGFGVGFLYAIGGEVVE